MLLLVWLLDRESRIKGYRYHWIGIDYEWIILLSILESIHEMAKGSSQMATHFTKWFIQLC
jgi:hypothetical protein